MSALGTRIRNGRMARRVRNPRAASPKPAGPPPAGTPYWLLWSTGIVALVLGAVAFLLWGINGVSTLFDMIVALCL